MRRRHGACFSEHFSRHLSDAWQLLHARKRVALQFVPCALCPCPVPCALCPLPFALCPTQNTYLTPN
ncbi:MAG: hypothetical protein DMG03_13410 [Acidobacteria bacterium]|nr:MAG: hypothetical protein DMG03_13410 [Acidobacteriota bacterium]